jgi:putative toxin-antitoxin system antitoxin component (TIGR02293 family)
MGRQPKKPAGYNAPENVSSGTAEEPVSVYQYAPQDSITARTIGLMGMSGRRDFTAIKNDNDLIALIRAGVPMQAMFHLMKIADISLKEMSLIIHTSDRTLRRYTAHQKLSQEQSERMVEMARLYSRGIEVFGAIDSFREWMDTRLLPFGNKTPKEFLDTSLGIAMIMDEMGKIQHGIFA